MRILFFGSTTDSVIVLEKLKNITAVVTQPPKPVGRDKIITPTPVEMWAHEHHTTVLSFPTNPEKPWLFADLQQVIDALEPIKADLLISASFGVKIPWETIEKTKYGGINIHPSILPRWRGADPVPWAILSGDHQIGVSVVMLSEKFDTGAILAQKKIPILPTGTSDPLRTKLFTIGAELLVDLLPQYCASPHSFDKTALSRKFVKTAQKKSAAEKMQTLPYARKFKRDNGFEEWENLQKAIKEGVDAERIERKWRALHPWPGVWTRLPGGSPMRRLKILKLHLEPSHTSSPIPHTLVLNEVQLEGKKPVSWEQFCEAYLI